VVTYAEVYNEQYRKFKAGQQQTVSGTPLSEAPFLTEGKRRELRALNIHTVEQLAGLDGANLKTLGMGGREWKNQARRSWPQLPAPPTSPGWRPRSQSSRRASRSRSQQPGARRPAPSSPPGNDGEAADKSIEDCTDEELREFIKKPKAARPHRIMPAAPP
jgi:hypothetical protein